MLFTRDEIEKRKLNDRIRLLEKQIEVFQVQFEQVLDVNSHLKKLTEDQKDENKTLRKAFKHLEKKIKQNEIKFIKDFDTKVTSLLKIIEFQEVQDKKKTIEIQGFKKVIEEQAKELNAFKEQKKEYETKYIQTEEIDHLIEEEKASKVNVEEALAASIIELEENKFQDANATIQRIFDTLKSTPCVDTKEVPYTQVHNELHTQNRASSLGTFESPHSELKNSVLRRLTQARTSSSPSPLRRKLFERLALHPTVDKSTGISQYMAHSLKSTALLTSDDTLMDREQPKLHNLSSLATPQHNVVEEQLAVSKEIPIVSVVPKNKYDSSSSTDEHPSSILFMDNGRLISEERPMSPSAA